MIEDGVIERFASLVAQVALEEELRLRRAAGEGIFFMPELAFAFSVGRVVAERSNEIFGESDWKWMRERKEGEVGPVDLIFAKGEKGPRLLVEFKMRDTLDAYVRDIDKLRQLSLRRSNSNDHFLFCALVDVWAKNLLGDSRLDLADQSGVKLVEPVTAFTTKQDWYRGQVACVVGVWEVT